MQCIPCVVKDERALPAAPPGRGRGAKAPRKEQDELALPAAPPGRGRGAKASSPARASTTALDPDKPAGAATRASLVPLTVKSSSASAYPFPPPQVAYSIQLNAGPPTPVRASSGFARELLPSPGARRSRPLKPATADIGGAGVQPMPTTAQLAQVILCVYCAPPLFSPMPVR
ncbi:hypothetical protein T492DRAFT_845077 [Pavlovales sp. CCMP2436]|nr:hypothetical protein T492DRAFT_845077 [Pavlovales sp. CCMP2436]